VRAPATLPRVLPLKRAAEESGIPYTSLRAAHFRGELAILKNGRAWYVTVDELRRWMEARTERGVA